MPGPRVFHDFQNVDASGRLRLVCVGTLRDLERQQVELREGMSLTFYTDDADDAGRPVELVADGVVQYNAEEKCWVGTIDWQAIRDERR